MEENKKNDPLTPSPGVIKSYDRSRMITINSLLRNLKK